MHPIREVFHRLLSRLRERRLEKLNRRSALRMAKQIDLIGEALLRSQSNLAHAVEENSRDLANYNAMLEDIRGQLKNLELDHAALESEAEGLRNRLKVAEDITIPTLTQAHKLVLERWEAETDIAIRSKVAVRQS